MRRRSTSGLAIGLALGLALALGAGCGGSSGGKKKKGPGAPKARTDLACGDLTTGLVKGIADPVPDFGVKKALSFHTIDVASAVDPSVTAITVRLVSRTGNADLHLAIAGSAPRSTRPAEYVIASTEAAGVEDWVRISLTGLESPGASVPSTTLQDYRNITGKLNFAVWGVETETEFDLEVICESVLSVTCGTDFVGSLPGSGQAPPDFEGSEVQFFELDTLPAAAGTVSIFANSTSGDVNLYLGRPGLAAASTDPSDYIFSSAASSVTSTADMIIVDGSGLHDVFGATNPTVSLADYAAAGSGLWFALAGLEAQNDYLVQVSCSDVIPLGCGDLANGAAQGSALTTPDLGNPLEAKFYQLEPLPSTAQSVTIDLASLGGDVDLWLAAPGAPPGSTDSADYIFSSTQRSPANADRITIDFGGLDDGAGGTSTAFDLGDYLSSGAPVGLVVTGWDPLSNYQISVGCVAPPIVIPIDCGDGFSGTIAGSGLFTPDLDDLGENLWFELVNLPASTSKIRIDLFSNTGNANLYLAGPDVVPGSQNPTDYVFVSQDQNFGQDAFLICSTGMTSVTGQIDTPNLTDYLAATENLSFVVAGFASTTDFDLQITCDTGPLQLPSSTIACGDTASGTVDGNNLFTPDFSDPVQNDFYEVVPLPGGGAEVEIRISHSPADIIAVFLGSPGTAPGSICDSDWTYASVGFFAPEAIIRVTGCGVESTFGTDPTVTIADYEAAGGMAICVWGLTPNANYDIDITCGGGGINLRTIDCGGMISDTVLGGSSFSDPTVSHHFEIPLASVQGASSIRIEVDVGGNDADIFLAEPGSVPGASCGTVFSFESLSAGNPDWIQIDGTGLSAADGGSDPGTTIADYQAASENLLFVVQGWDPSTDYTVTIICN